MMWWYKVFGQLIKMLIVYMSTKCENLSVKSAIQIPDSEDILDIHPSNLSHAHFKHAFPVFLWWEKLLPHSGQLWSFVPKCTVKSSILYFSCTLLMWRITLSLSHQKAFSVIQDIHQSVKWQTRLEICSSDLLPLAPSGSLRRSTFSEQRASKDSESRLFSAAAADESSPPTGMGTAVVKGRT